MDRRRDDECWPWLASIRGRRQYGQFWVPPGELENEKGWMAQAHCVAFRLIQGRWPDPFGLHGCDYPLCCNAVNPEHVHEGTQCQNIHEMFARGRGRPRGRVPMPQEREQQIYDSYRSRSTTRDAFVRQEGISGDILYRIIRDMEVR